MGWGKEFRFWCIARKRIEVVRDVDGVGYENTMGAIENDRSECHL